MLPDQHCPDCLHKSQNVILAIAELLHSQITPWIERDIIVIVIQLLVLYLISPGKVPQTHVTQTITAPDLDPVIHIATNYFPPLHSKNLLRPELVYALEERKLIAEIMHEQT
jgi:hypothetical protein